MTHVVTGAAGFIGSHLVERLVSEGHHVLGVDNLSRGVLRNLDCVASNPRFRFLEADLAQKDSLSDLLTGVAVDTVWHLAANSDIAAGAVNPWLDLRDTFQTTFHVLCAMRSHRLTKLVFASSSAVYGVHQEPLREDSGPLFPISNYGAMKLASEAAISAAAETVLRQVWILRFPNVVGSRATHGILFDLLQKLSCTPNHLEVLGDGNQRKPYLHVAELLDAMLLVHQKSQSKLNCFNIGPADDGITVKSIAEEVLSRLQPTLPIRFVGGDRGWVGDVPSFRYSIEQINSLGWQPKLSSGEAVKRAIRELTNHM